MNRLHFLATGSELLSGFVMESNAHWLQKELRGKAALMEREVILPDGFEGLVEGIASELGRCDLLIICGGLGPTDDDLTREAIAKATGKNLKFSNEAWADIEEFFLQRKKEVSPSNKKQAFIPEDGKVLLNPRGTAPGIEMNEKGTRVLAVPGVPSEFRTMLSKYLIEELEEARTGPVFKLWGIGESVLVDVLREKKTLPSDVLLGTIARPEGITLRLESSFWDRDDAEDLLLSLRRDLADYIVAEREISPVLRLAELAKEGGWTIGTAESCTGGLLAEKFTRESGSSEYFLGSIVSYSNSVKTGVLGVDPQVLEHHGAVSEEVAIEMARGAMTSLGVDLAMSITGIAGPGGGTESKPVGTVHLAVVHRDGWELHQEGKFGGDRGDIRERSAHGVAALALEGLKAHG